MCPSLLQTAGSSDMLTSLIAYSEHKCPKSLLLLHMAAHITISTITVLSVQVITEYSDK